jgi:hypothetical protein
MQVSRSIWNGRVTDPKTRKGRAPVPVIRQLAERLEMHRLRCRNTQSGPIFANAMSKPLGSQQHHKSPDSAVPKPL